MQHSVCRFTLTDKRTSAACKVDVHGTSTAYCWDVFFRRRLIFLGVEYVRHERERGRWTLNRFHQIAFMSSRNCHT